MRTSARRAQRNPSAAPLADHVTDFFGVVDEHGVPGYLAARLEVEDGGISDDGLLFAPFDDSCSRLENGNITGAPIASTARCATAPRSRHSSLAVDQQLTHALARVARG